eukprot:9314991-Alexandrium_andersonii.AAC.1
MSASLVGSEMCIRDRLCLARLILCSVGLGVGSAWPDLVLVLAWPGRVWLCLLYTSDAADDM